MKLEQVIATLQEIASFKSTSASECEVVVSVHSPGSMGPSPAVKICGIHAGFDWDNGRVLIQTEHALTRLTQEQVKDITTSVQKGSSWHAYEHAKKQKAALDAVTAERDALASECERLRQMLSSTSTDDMPAGLGGVLTFTSAGTTRPCGQQVGADGAGDFSVLIFGSKPEVHAKARAMLRDLERAGHRLTNITLVYNGPDEGYYGSPVTAVYCKQGEI